MQGYVQIVEAAPFIYSAYGIALSALALMLSNSWIAYIKANKHK